MEGPELLADEDVAGVGALGDGGDLELRRELGGKVLERMHGEVDAAVFKRFLNLLDEDSFAVKARRRDKAGLLHAVASGADDFDLGLKARIAQGIGDVVGLPKCELRTARADADGGGFHVFCRIQGRRLRR